MGPFCWPWTRDLLEIFGHVWESTSRLTDLVLETQSDYGYDEEPRPGGDFAPLLPSLIAHSSHIHLRTFKCDMWLRPHSNLECFLASQPNINQLIGVDVFASRKPVLRADFLPSLEILVCNRPATVEVLAPMRPLRILRVYDGIPSDIIMGLVLGLERCSGPLTSVRLGVDKFPSIEWQDRFFKRLATTKTLCLPCCDLFMVHPTPTIPVLEELKCFVRMLRQPALVTALGHTATEVENFAARLSPALHSIVFDDYLAGHYWAKIGSGTRYV